jgi:hypothetical protein
MKNVVIIESKRTAIGKAYKGSLKNTRPDIFDSIITTFFIVYPFYINNFNFLMKIK